MKYINMDYPSDELAKLCDKGLLAETKNIDTYWVDKNLFNSSVFQPKHIASTEEDRSS